MKSIVLASGVALATLCAGAASAQTAAPAKPPVAVPLRVQPAAGPDLNGDGRLSPEEFRTLREQPLQRLDANHDGSISTAEVEADEDRGIASEVASTFKKFDTNGDGSVSKAEMAAVIKAEVAAKRGGGGLGPIDMDKNGAITKAEIDQAADSDFKVIDANHDGFISREEMAAAQGGPAQRAAARPVAPKSVKAPTKPKR